MNFRFLILHINDIIMPMKGGVVCVNTGILSLENKSFVTVLRMNVKIFSDLPGKLLL